jgi:formate-dependent phosphoribosylglycinamide formyltransferase (GAR transformylase)
MKQTMSIELNFSDGVEAFRKAFARAGDDVTIRPVMGWTGYGHSETKVCTGIEVEWKETL